MQFKRRLEPIGKLNNRFDPSNIDLKSGRNHINELATSFKSRNLESMTVENSANQGLTTVGQKTKL